MDEETANAVIMAARAHWFEGEDGAEEGSDGGAEPHAEGGEDDGPQPPAAG